MDKTTKTILILWLCTIVVITTGAYYGSKRGDLGGTDKLVEDMAATAGGYKPTTPLPLSKTGENIAFTIGGLFAGIVIGYYWTQLDKKTQNKEQIDDTQNQRTE